MRAASMIWGARTASVTAMKADRMPGDSAAIAATATRLRVSAAIAATITTMLPMMMNTRTILLMIHMISVMIMISDSSRRSARNPDRTDMTITIPMETIPAEAAVRRTIMTMITAGVHGGSVDIRFAVSS